MPRNNTVLHGISLRRDEKIFSHAPCSSFPIVAVWPILHTLCTGHGLPTTFLPAATSAISPRAPLIYLPRAPCPRTLLSSLLCTLHSFSSLSVIVVLSPHLSFVVMCSHHLVHCPWLPYSDNLSTLIVKTPFSRVCSHKACAHHLSIAPLLLSCAPMLSGTFPFTALLK